MWDHIAGENGKYAVICETWCEDGDYFRREYAGALNCKEAYEAAIKSSLAVVRSIGNVGDAKVDIFVVDGHTKNIMLPEDVPVNRGGKWLISASKHMDIVNEIRAGILKLSNVEITDISKSDKIACLNLIIPKFIEKYGSKFEEMNNAARDKRFEFKKL